MTLATADAEAIFRSRFGEPVKPPTDYVVGFKTTSGKVLAIHRQATETRIWFQPPEPPNLDGVRLMSNPSNGNSNINGPLLPLRAPTTLRVEVDDRGALNRFIDWYNGSGSIAHASPTVSDIKPIVFREAFARFQALVTTESGYPLTGFHEGLVAVWESYKPRLRDHALGLLRAGEWLEGDIGSGTILSRMIEAIEIQDNRLNLTNNLVFWQNRFGHANRDHRVLLEAKSTPKLRREIERQLFDLYCGDIDERMIFDRLSDLTAGKYPLLAYVFFLKDMNRFMPIQPTGFDRSFRALGIDFTTLRQCSWENYSTYCQTLAALQPLIAASTGLKKVRLVDAHSFCWVFSTLLKQEADGITTTTATRHSGGRVVGGWERSIIEMRTSILNTVRNANGQVVERYVKDKQLLMDTATLDELIRSRLALQRGTCNLTGLLLHPHGPGADTDLLPSVDRIDSSRHYELDNIQIVCRFINFWKGASDNENFKRLLMLVRGVEQ